MERGKAKHGPRPCTLSNSVFAKFAVKKCFLLVRKVSIVRSVFL